MWAAFDWFIPFISASQKFMIIIIIIIINCEIIVKTDLILFNKSTLESSCRVATTTITIKITLASHIQQKRK